MGKILEIRRKGKENISEGKNHLQQDINKTWLWKVEKFMGVILGNC